MVGGAHPTWIKKYGIFMSINSIGLIFDIIGILIIAFDELTSIAAQVAQYKEKIDGNWFKMQVIMVARKYGSKKPLNQQGALADTIAIKAWGLIFVLFGFIFQFIGSQLSNVDLKTIWPF